MGENTGGGGDSSGEARVRGGRCSRGVGKKEVEGEVGGVSLVGVRLGSYRVVE